MFRYSHCQRLVSSTLLHKCISSVEHHVTSIAAFLVCVRRSDAKAFRSRQLALLLRYDAIDNKEASSSHYSQGVAIGQKLLVPTQLNLSHRQSHWTTTKHRGWPLVKQMKVKQNSKQHITQEIRVYRVAVYVGWNPDAGNMRRHRSLARVYIYIYIYISTRSETNKNGYDTGYT